MKRKLALHVVVQLFVTGLLGCLSLASAQEPRTPLPATVDLKSFTPPCPALVKERLRAKQQDRCELLSFGTLSTPDMLGYFEYAIYVGPDAKQAMVILKPDASYHFSTAHLMLLRTAANEDYGTPAFYQRSTTTLFVIPAYEATDVRSSDDLVSRFIKGQLVAVAHPFQWVDQLRTLPNLHGQIYANRSPDYEKMTGEVSIWSNDDAVCCPTRVALATLALEGDAIILKKVVVRPR